MLCMRLEAEGIKAFIPDQNTASMQPFYSDAMGGVLRHSLASYWYKRSYDTFL